MKWLINAQAGGILNGVYQQSSPAKNRFCKFEKFTAYEGEITRKIAALLCTKMTEMEDVSFLVIHDAMEDTPQAKRIQLINDIVSKEKDCLLLNFACDSQADGFEVYGDPSVNDIFGYNLADKIVEFGSYKETVNEETKQFLSSLHCRTVALNLLSYKKEKQAEFLLMQRNQERIADCIYQVIKQVETKLI